MPRTYNYLFALKEELGNLNKEMAKVILRMMDCTNQEDRNREELLLREIRAQREQTMDKIKDSTNRTRKQLVHDRIMRKSAPVTTGLSKRELKQTIHKQESNFQTIKRMCWESEQKGQVIRSLRTLNSILIKRSIQMLEQEDISGCQLLLRDWYAQSEATATRLGQKTEFPVLNALEIANENERQRLHMKSQQSQEKA